MVRENFPRHISERSIERRRRGGNFVPTLLGISALSILGGNIVGISTDDAAVADLRAATSRTSVNNAVSDVASDITGESIRVDCNDEVLNSQDRRHPLIENNITYITAGMVRHPLRPIPFMPGVITLREDICETIIGFDAIAPEGTIDSPTYQGYLEEVDAYANSIGTLLHEIEHTQGIQNEAQADCYAYQKLPGVLRVLGIAPTDALTSSYAAIDTIGPSRLERYKSQECHSGGEYDLAISDVYIGDNT